MRRNSRASQFGWRKKPSQPGLSPRATGDRQPLVLPYLDNLNLPYADDSNAVTPTSDDLCNPSSNTHGMLAHRRRLSSTSYTSHRMSPHVMGGSRRSSFVSHHSRHSGAAPGPATNDRDSLFASFKERREPTVFMWNTSMKHHPQAGSHSHHQQQQQHRAVPLLPEVIVPDNDDSVSCCRHQQLLILNTHFFGYTTILFVLFIATALAILSFVPYIRLVSMKTCRNIILCAARVSQTQCDIWRDYYLSISLGSH